MTPETRYPPQVDNESGLADMVADLQMRLTYQEDEIAHLNRALEQQRAALERFGREIDRLRRLLATLTPAQAGAPGDERPPHY